MKFGKLILLILALSFVTFVYSNDSDKVKCHQGDQNPQADSTHQQDPLAGASTIGVTSVDPNEIVGPTGYDSVRWVSIDDVLNYTIFFENDPEFATANAQKVDVRFDFEDKEQIKGFRLGQYGFANMSWNMKEDAAAYDGRMDLTDSMHIYVDLRAGIDVVKRQAFWTFSSIDPETGFAPWQHDRGMLPVNDSTHVGEGFVKFSLTPPSGMETGDTISIMANIVFDQNDTIATNRWRVTVDAGKPESRVRGRADSKNENLFHLTIEAADDKDGSGLKRVVLYEANAFGIYEEMCVCPLDTVIDFEAEPGRQYRFFTLAEDNVGNREELKEKPDFEVNVNAAPTDIALSDSVFRDDIEAGGFIAELSSVDVEQGGAFTYALAEGEGAADNDLFAVEGSQLLAKGAFACAEDTLYSIRLSTTDEGGMTFAKAFRLHLRHVLERPEPDTLAVSICEGDVYTFHGTDYDEAGTYRFTKGNDFMCDSVFVLQLSVLPQPEPPTVTVEGVATLVSSAAKGNQWFRQDGTPVEGATGQRFTPTEDGTYYVAAGNGACYSEPSEAYRVQLTDRSELSLDLVEGWNWLSSNIADAQYRQAKDFLAPIAASVERMEGDGGELAADGQGGLSGSLGSMQPTAAYLLLAGADVAHTWSGTAYAPESTPVALHEGWNSMGYLPTGAYPVAEALKNLAPQEGDVVKDYFDFAIYSGGQWTGTLSEMAPGRGYMYLAARDASFTYPVTRVFPAGGAARSQAPADATATPWQAAVHKYPHNMTMVADVVRDGVAPAGLYTVGAFVGDECRGVGRYVGDKLFMTIYGDADAQASVTFRAVDNTTQELLPIRETTTFANAMLGSPAAPFRLTVDDGTGIGAAKAAGAYSIYPNPVRTTLFVSGDTDRLRMVTVLSANGSVVARTDSYTPEGIDVTALLAGTYIVVLDSDTGRTVKKMLKVD